VRTYPETLDFLFGRLPLFSQIGPAALKPSLDNILALCEALGNPQEKFKSIHIAGTNGKGSTSHMLASVLQSHDYKTGLYTSPHLQDFRERIKINGVLVSEEFVVDFVNRIEKEVNQIEPSFFELTVAMAFQWFAENRVDIAVIETGLGGRLDSTNIITPILSVITNIGWDHMQQLGNTLALIAGEKAGIIKKEVPVVIGEYVPETRPVFEAKAREMNSPIFFASDLHTVQEWEQKNHTLTCLVSHGNQVDADRYHLDLTGIYQTKNLLTVLESIHQLERIGWPLQKQKILAGIEKTARQTGLHGRWEQIAEKPTIVLDVAHNEDGMQQVLQQLECMNYHHLHLITGMVKDKAVEKVIAMMPADAQYYFTQAQIPRALDAHTLQEIARQLGRNGDVYPNVNKAIQSAKSMASADDLILICGSVFLVAEVNRSMANH
jgi:dihydrofolate synthase / folylpolyglutamate synthase